MKTEILALIFQGHAVRQPIPFGVFVVHRDGSRLFGERSVRILEGFGELIALFDAFFGCSFLTLPVYMCVFTCLRVLAGKFVALGIGHIEERSHEYH